MGCDTIRLMAVTRHQGPVSRFRPGLCPGFAQTCVGATSSPEPGPVHRLRLGWCPVFDRRGNPSLDSRPQQGVPYGSTVWISVTSPEEEHGQQRLKAKGWADRSK